MVALDTDRRGPDWDRLYETAAGQAGYFTTAQAAEAGYSPQLMARYLAGRRVVRTRRGVYRLVHFPAGEHEDLVVLWLWSDRAGVFSHETALTLHELSDALPARAYLTVPAAWRRRRLRVPEGTVLHYADLDERDTTWVGSLPVTTPARTVLDCAQAHVSPDLVRQAIDEGIRRGLFTRDDVSAAEAVLGSFGGVTP